MVILLDGRACHDPQCLMMKSTTFRNVKADASISGRLTSVMVVLFISTANVATGIVPVSSFPRTVLMTSGNLEESAGKIK